MRGAFDVMLCALTATALLALTSVFAEMVAGMVR